MLIHGTPTDGDHKNIITTYRTKFMMKCKHFLEYLIKQVDYKEIDRHIFREYNNKIITKQKRELRYREKSNTESLSPNNNISNNQNVNKSIKLNKENGNNNNSQKFHFAINNFAV